MSAGKSKYTIDECRQADQWVKSYALVDLNSKLSMVRRDVRNYVLLMVRCNYGSIETDKFLQAMKCYPDWLK